MMNILYLACQDPRKTEVGGQQRTFLLWNALQKHGNVYTIVPVFGRLDPADKIYFWDLNASEFRGQLKYGLKEYLNFLLWWKTGLAIKPLYSFPDVKKIFPGIKFDMVVCRHFKVLDYFNPYDIAPTFIDLDDYPLTLFKTVITQQKKYNFIFSFIWGNLLRLELWWHSLQWAGAWVSNREDLGKTGTKNRTMLLNNIPLNVYDGGTAPLDRNILFMIGGAFYYPNVDGLNNFLTTVWPIIHKKHPNLRFFIVGRGWEGLFEEKWKCLPNVECTGFVSNLGELYAKCLATVVPIDSGAGTCIKTLESLSNGRICFATPFGARGLSLTKSELSDIGVMVYEKPDDFLSTLEKILALPEWRKEREKSARMFIRENYSRASFDLQVSSLLNR
ncbi:MAG: Glycosyl transferases group 1 [Lentisphaerae bacterium ADurb.Bin082]|nr:MAG: Glycosyl transferases group 1 [Lentisphaerae bacterium ADurb.Bin082]